MYDGDEGDEGEGEEGEGEEGEEQSYLLFSSENWRWPSWMPGLHLEVIRRRSVEEHSYSTTQVVPPWARRVGRRKEALS